MAPEERQRCGLPEWLGWGAGSFLGRYQIQRHRLVVRALATPELSNQVKNFSFAPCAVQWEWCTVVQEMLSEQSSPAIAGKSLDLEGGSALIGELELCTTSPRNLTSS